ncbi:MAG: hypothetical protein C0200_01330 [Thermoproteota archaeon]|nr:MAG: hypothetical protein C0200_01330 [Candidatus Korarchaeota archaeon]
MGRREITLLLILLLSFTAGNAIIAAYLYLCYGDAGALRKAMLGSLGALIAFFEILIIIWISNKYFKDYKWP